MPLKNGSLLSEPLAALTIESKLAAISISYRIMLISAFPSKAERRGGLFPYGLAAYLS
jgi:hypothetical protein